MARAWLMPSNSKLTRYSSSSSPHSLLLLQATLSLRMCRLSLSRLREQVRAQTSRLARRRSGLGRAVSSPHSPRDVKRGSAPSSLKTSAGWGTGCALTCICDCVFGSRLACLRCYRYPSCPRNMSARSSEEQSPCSFKTPCKVDRRKSPGFSTPSPKFAIPASPFMQKFGYGTGVSVYLMKRSPKGLSHSPWAVKKINKQCDKSSKNVYEQRLNEEAKILKNLNHPNIVGYRAFTKSKDGSLCLAMEYGGDKSLYDLIEDRSENDLGPFPAAVILKVALHMARGLKYLHNDKKILHGDLKSSNVVIKGDFETIKICDVGVCLPLDENMTMSDPQAFYIGTEAWKPKEALDEGGVITDKSDIYAFGLTLWEMMALSIPHINLPPEGDDDEEDSFDEDDFDEDAYYEALGTRPPLNMEELDDSYQRVIEIFYVCTSENPKERPSAVQILEALEAGNVQ